MSWNEAGVLDDTPQLAVIGAVTRAGSADHVLFDHDAAHVVHAETQADLANLQKEVEQIGLASWTDVKDGCVVRQKKAYPVYDDGYKANVETIRAELALKFPTLHLVGRNGMHKYNNQDHAMMTALLTV